MGLVLEGGGALGFAHVGVLKVLEEEQIPVHFIVGTSMGSIVGVGYASGMLVSKTEDVLSIADWDKLFNEAATRSMVDFRHKADRDQSFLGMRSFVITTVLWC